MKNTSAVQDYMTPCPQSVSIDSSIGEAMAMMEENDFRHLPVTQEGHAVGLLSEREIKRYESFFDRGQTRVSEVMISDPYVVDKKTNVSEVIRVMAQNKYGSAIVKGSGNQVVGIFTTTDALNLISKTMEEKEN
ncbi:MAG: CBS domain-containing protein [Bdellovibrionaceae bacterium]|nr:CBS domain-containing protein [Pseudobdellovibrionaceae bacterium]|tara:strand:- start:256 stop:657 length:402 start_codon:yes stop_codon:yes gene_type:complete